MATTKFPRKLFEKEIGKLDEKMQDRVVMFGTTIESLTDTELELDILSDRPDFLSYHGFKRSFLAFLGKKTGLKEYKINKPEKDFHINVESSVEDVRPFTACAIVKNLKLDNEKIKEIIELQEKIHNTLGRKRKKLAIGIYPLEKIKLPITYKAMEPDKIKFIPLEMEKEMDGLQILQRHPAGRDYAHLLAGKVKFPIFVDANNSILSMPPIINSQLTGKVTEQTKDLFLECSGFDFNVLSKCLNIIVTSLAEMGGEVYQMEVKYKKAKITPDLTSEKNPISLENTNKMLGLTLTEKELRTLLEKMGHNYEKGIVESPAWRVDLLHEVDLIEDVAKAYGYENFVPEIPQISTIGKIDSKEEIKKKIADILAGVGMLEISNLHLTNKREQFTNMGIQEKQEKGYIPLEESKTDYNILRKDLSHYAMKILSENVDNEYPQKIFETGRVFNITSLNKIIEEEHLSLAITPGNFTELKQTIEYLFRMLNLQISLKEPKDSKGWMIDGRDAEIILDNNAIGILGEIHPKILKNWKIKMPVALLEINLEEVFKKLM